MRRDDEAENEILAAPVIRQILPKPLRLSDVAPDQVAMHYDRRSDTLLTHLSGRGRDSISVRIGRSVSVLVTPDTEEVIGLHIEGVLARQIIDLPEAVGLLNFAELRGITPAEVRALHVATLGIEPAYRYGFPGQAPRDFAARRWEAVTSFIAAEQTRWNLPFLSAA